LSNINRFSGKTVWQSAFGPCFAILAQRVVRFETMQIATLRSR